MSDKGRLCNVCGHWVHESEDLVILRDGMGVAHLECAWRTKDDPDD